MLGAHAGEERRGAEHLREHRAHGPEVHRRPVGYSFQNLRSDVAGRACWLNVEQFSSSERAEAGQQRPPQASKLPRRRSGVRRSGLSPRRHQAGRWGGVVRQLACGGHVLPSGALVRAVDLKVGPDLPRCGT